MTTDELKKEAEEYLYKRLQFDKGFIEQELHRKYNPTEAWEKFEPIDPIINETLEAYLASAEPREKRIAELETTCNKWFQHLKNREEELLNELNNQNAKYNKQIEELEKENAELKKEIRLLKTDISILREGYENE